MAVLCELHRVRYKVGKDLTDASRVTDHVAWCVRTVVDDDLDSVLARMNGVLVPNVFGGNEKIEWNRLDVDLPRFNL